MNDEAVGAITDDRDIATLRVQAVIDVEEAPLDVVRPDVNRPAGFVVGSELREKVRQFFPRKRGVVYRAVPIELFRHDAVVGDFLSTHVGKVSTKQGRLDHVI